MCSATVKDQRFVTEPSDPDVMWTVPHTAAYEPLCPLSRQSRKESLLARQQMPKGPLCIKDSSQHRAKGKLSCSDMTQGARDNTVKRDSQRWEHAAALCFHLTTLEGSHFVGVSGFASDTQRLRSHKSYKLINRTNPLPVIIFSFVLISFTKPRCVSVYTPSSQALSPSPALSASHRCSEADQTPAWICAPLKSGISMCI